MDSRRTASAPMAPPESPYCRRCEGHVCFGAASSKRKHRILIIDDDPNLRQVCPLAIACDCFECVEADGGKAGLALAREQSFDLVLLDVEMPDMRGNEVLRHLRRNPSTPHMKIVMFSGNVGAEYLSQLLLDGADSYLMKPMHSGEGTGTAHLCDPEGILVD